MTNPKISIDRIDLRTKGIPPEIARSALNGLSQEIANNLTQQGFIKPGQPLQLGDLNLGTLNLTRSRDYSELRREIARVLTHAIATRIGRI